MADQFVPADPRVPEDIVFTKAILTKNTDGTYAAKYDVKIRFSDGSQERRSGNLIPHLTAGQTTAAQGFMDDLFTKAVNEFMP